MKRTCFTGFIAVGIQAVFAHSAFAQNFNRQALIQALHQQALGGGQYEGMFTPTPRQMLQGIDRNTIQELVVASNVLARNPNDVNALVQRGEAAAEDAIRQSMYRTAWLHFAAKDLERALRLDPNNFLAHHYYGDVCYKVGDTNDAQPVMHLAVTHFTKAIQLHPDAHSYMGRGWAYLMLDDQAHAQADFQKALQLDPSLRPQLVREANSVLQTRRQKGCVQAMMKRMGAYVVNRSARTKDQCDAAKGYWTGSECRISTAMAPGPIMAGPQDSATGNAGLGAGNCAPPPNAPDNRYDPRLGGYVVR